MRRQANSARLVSNPKSRVFRGQPGSLAQQSNLALRKRVGGLGSGMIKLECAAE